LRIGGKCGPASGDPIDVLATVRAINPHHEQQALGPARVNMGLSVWASDHPESISGIGESASLVFMTDSLGPNCSVWPSAQPRAYNPAIRHAGRVNVAFLDGHVASLPGREIGQGIGPVENDEVRWRVEGSNWPGPPM